MTSLSPIILFVYNRPWHTRQTVEALQKNDLAAESQLFIYADGSKTENDTEVKEVRDYIKVIDGFKSVTIIERERNWGIEENVIHGVTEIINQFGKIIVLEDDIVTSKYFLNFMNTGLENFSGVSNVFAINGHMFPINSEKYQSFLSNLGTSAWGWGTWSDKWCQLEKTFDDSNFMQTSPDLISRFNFGGYNYLNLINLETWDIRWYYSVYLRNGVGVYPSQSLVRNIGFDGSGVHYTKKIEVLQELSDKPIEVIVTNKIDWELNSLLYTYYTDYYNLNKMTKITKINKNHLLARLKRKMKNLLGSFK